MFGHFYNSSLRRYIVLMGDLFSRITVARQRRDGINYIKVPISYTTKEKFAQILQKYNSITSTEDVAKVETILPRMNLQLVDMMYNPTYKTQQNIRSQMVKDEKRIVSQYNPTPYKMIFELGIYTRYEDDVFQIIEQILPYFQPHFNTTITELHENIDPIERDIRIVYQSISPDESSDGDRYTRRHIEWSIMFEVNGWIYPPVAEINGEIRTIYLNFSNERVELTPDGDFTEFESVDHQVDPYDIDEKDWDGKTISTYSRNTPIPTDPEKPGPR